MPWDQQTIALYPRLTDNSIRGRMIRDIAKLSLEAHQPGHKWDDVNPEVRAWWCNLTDTFLKAAQLHKEQQVK